MSALLSNNRGNSLKTDPLSPLRKEVREVQDRHPELSADNAFIGWFSSCFYCRSTALGFIVGGARDKGIDALHIDHENMAVSVVQAKYRQNPNAAVRIVQMYLLWPISAGF